MSDRFDRRHFLQRGGLAALALSPVGELLAKAGAANRPAAAAPAAGYGPLRAVRDSNTGLPLLKLPAGFSYISFGWAGEKLTDGTLCPGSHDGMGVVHADGDVLTLVRNHEVVRADGAFGPADMHYDPACGGGTVTLRFDAAAGRFVDARPSLSGTLQNCAGGVTPWGSWLTCEEFVSGADTEARLKERSAKLQKAHGFVFEVPAAGTVSVEPLRALGQFRHEAATVHVATGDVYLTEDFEPQAGFYRFVPKTRGKLADGGRLQMLKAVGMPDLRSGLEVGRPYAVEWVDIDEPERGFDAATGGIVGVQNQGFARGASRFTRLEGCIAHDDDVYFTATNGGDASCGQVFVFHPSKSELVLLYESTDPDVLDYPDNVVVSPRGGLVICQDSKQERQHLYGMTPAGALFPFAVQNVVLDGAFGFSGDYRTSEWAGCCFSPDGRWLFANVYAPGFTVAITGPWKDGLI